MESFSKIAELNASSASPSLVPSAKPVFIDEDTKYRVSFLFNNLSVTSLSSVCHEINDLIITQNSDDVVAWLARYIVTKRVAAEPNQHDMYLQLLANINKKLLMKAVLNETYQAANTMFNSASKYSASNHMERKVLKNIGHWLGLVTIAQDQQIDLDLKKLLIEAFVDGENKLLLTVPFVAAVLKSVEKSTTFTTNDTWVQQLLCVLAGLHKQPDLKLKLEDIEAFDVMEAKKTLSSTVPPAPRISPLEQYIEHDTYDWTIFIQALDATI
ncbi:unnamed protein product [Bursaphelenchus okinawaensis]|uniref:CCR4-NOT transcription complex subunit 1 CAF1-binding domain-containing protein n=1 Tax=Bursaphelenchus okinawaensis TaxID=465554 RepID=A0A811KHW2_9BILA|nr:unnamed protein product [Bursaphelenchus okinawaensis]CAG9102736.1 unnamed protein product [Bursaphelenchus okinawaensis]